MMTFIKAPVVVIMGREAKIIKSLNNLYILLKYNYILISSEQSWKWSDANVSLQMTFMLFRSNF